MRRAILALCVVLAACGGDGAESTTTVPVAAGSDAATVASTTTTTVPATTTTTAAPTTTTTPPVADASSCVVGTWELDSEDFVSQVFEAGLAELPPEAGEVSVAFGGGSYTVQLSDDGTYTGDRDEWQFRFESSEGTIVNTLDGTETGTWAVEGDSITISSEVSDVTVTVEVEVDGVVQQLPIAPEQTVQTEIFTGSGTVTCDDDALEVTFGGFTSRFDRR